ncbi:hypothetical protein HanXRQr2_Chr11g0490311 [Helianthus annuus]|uniref:Uncharacterized protein n=1 Tax=Helianthus annuus TaxID=4232 RepID=A0A9K3HPU2_HELAN|nr:hypothetical protein HanXRQr2_Chr11g0490311 [Helianthus annuus]
MYYLKTLQKLCIVNKDLNFYVYYSKKLYAKTIRKVKSYICAYMIFLVTK